MQKEREREREKSEGGRTGIEERRRTGRREREEREREGREGGRDFLLFFFIYVNGVLISSIVFLWHDFCGVITAPLARRFTRLLRFSLYLDENCSR